MSILFLIVFSFAASAQSKQQGATQVVTINIQKTTLVDLSRSYLSQASTDNKSSSSKNPSGIIKKTIKEIILASAEDKTYVKLDGPDEVHEPSIAIITQTAL